ncbi:MAG: hypothetical protein JXA01_01010 [Dehalococcoidia bacterium]|nr:hypothetical protein [Dehalococcoidia bacterium]
MDLEKIGEVVETSNSEFLAQCYDLDGAPPLGSMVKTGGKGGEIYGIVYLSATHSVEPGRRITVRGKSHSSEADVFKANPQLAKLLCMDFKALVVGYSGEKGVFQYLPPSPVPIYAFAYTCTPEEVRVFTQTLDFLNLMIESRLPVSQDEVIAAFLRYASRTHPEPEEFLVKAGKELAWTLSNDIRRLDSILKRLKQ